MLKGTLDDFTLPDIFRLLSMAKRTGTLEVTRSAGSGKVFFRAGDVYFAQSSLTREPLGRKLIRARAITEGQLMKALDEHAATRRRVGEILVASELVTLEQLEDAVREQIEDSVFDLLRWDLGEFEWEPGSEAEVEVPIAVSVENLIMEASRRLDELEVIKRKIPGVHAVLRMAPKPPEGAVEINITPEEWRILVLVDGTRTVADIAEAVALDEFGALRVLYGLVAAGLIELSPETPAGEDDAAAAGLVELSPEAPPSEDDLAPAHVNDDDAAAAPAFSLAVDLSPHHDLSDELPEPLIAALDDVGGIALDDDAAAALAAFDAPGADELTTVFPPEAPAPEAPAADAPLDEAPAADASVDEAAPEAPVDETPVPAAAVDEAPVDEAPAHRISEVDASYLDAAPPEVPAPPADGSEPSIDRAAVVRELAGLFGDEDRPRAPRGTIPATPQRVEDDDQITKGLISRLIDGVKGL